MSRKNLEKFDKTKDTIKMEDFVIHYLNDDVLIKCRKLTHKDLKSFNNPYVVTVSYEFASANMELILTNKIILVIDRLGHVAPYINPNELKKIQNLDVVDEQIAKLKKVRINQLKKLISLWSDMQMLLYEKRSIEATISLLEEIKKQSRIEQLGGKSYVKEYQRR